MDISSEEGTSEAASEELSSVEESSEESSEEEGPIKAISLNKKELDIIKGKRSDSLLVSFFPDLGSDYHDVSWSSSDETIATVDAYGRVSGIEVGSCLVTATSLFGGAKASCKVYVLESAASYKTEYLEVDDLSTLAPGDILIIGCPEEGKAAGHENTGMYLHPVDASYSGNKLTSYAGAAEFMLDGERNHWTFEYLSDDPKEEDYLGCTNEKKVTFFNKKGNIYWGLSFDEGHLYMESTSNVPGWMMYNAKDGKFTLYESNPQVDMFTISLYRYTKTRIL